ncbi:MAG: helix-turn-helix domain-containing protein [Alphaproteobacteria bacterium]|nr:helix-turn-helix domain-containing protein [Alphaproteobacteria bacterium]
MEEIIFPNQIRMFRRVRGKPMKKLAEVLGLSLSAISKIEKGYRRIDEAQLEIVSKFLDCPKEAIFVSEYSSQPEVIKAWKNEQDRRSNINEGGGLKTLGAGLRYIRGQKKLTLNQVAKGAKMTLSVYHRIEMGQREVDEKTFRDIARALGFSDTELQLKIYELDMSGALEELKQAEGKSGLYVSKGGYNDLPVSRFMLKGADSKERTVSIYGVPTENGLIKINRDEPTGSMVCPSTLSEDADLYGISLTTETLGTVLPYRCVLVASPSKTPKMGDIAVWPQGENNVKLVSVVQNKMGKFFAATQEPQELKELSASDMEKMHKVVLIAMP